MLFDAVSGNGFNFFNSSIALMPSGVAALVMPNMFAVIFRAIDPGLDDHWGYQEIIDVTMGTYSA